MIKVTLNECFCCGASTCGQICGDCKEELERNKPIEIDGATLFSEIKAVGKETFKMPKKYHNDFKIMKIVKGIPFVSKDGKCYQLPLSVKKDGKVLNVKEVTKYAD